MLPTLQQAKDRIDGLKVNLETIKLLRYLTFDEKESITKRLQHEIDCCERDIENCFSFGNK